jgi:cell shape-determining protein MreC
MVSSLIKPVLSTVSWDLDLDLEKEQYFETEDSNEENKNRNQNKNIMQNDVQHYEQDNCHH